MCPACLASAALLVGSVFSAGGLTALTAKVISAQKISKRTGSSDPSNFPDPEPSAVKTKEKQS